MTEKADIDLNTRKMREIEQIVLKDPEKALEIAHELIQYAQEHDLKPALIDGYLGAGTAYEQLNNEVDAVLMFKHGLELAEQEGLIEHQVKLHYALGNYYLRMNDMELASQCNVRALELANQLNDPKVIIRVKESFLRIFSDLENHEKALELAQDVRAYWQNTDNYILHSRSLNNMGIIYGRMGNSEKAIECYREALDLVREHEYIIGEAYILNNLGSICMQENQFEQAIDYLQESLRLKAKNGDHTDDTSTILNLMEAHSHLGHIEIADEYMRKAEEIVQKKPSNHSEMRLARKKTLYFRKKAQILAARNQHGAAYEAYEQTFEQYDVYNDAITKLYSDKTSRRVAELEVHYEVMKREQEARFHQEQNIELSRKNEEIQSQRKQLQEMLERLSQREEQLTKANAAKDRFLSIIAHDLKTPLSGVISGIELLKLQSVHSNEPKIEKVLKIIDHSASNLATLLQNLLDWARTQRGEIKYCPKEFCMIDLIHMISELYFYSAESKKVSIEVEQNTDRMVYADPDMVYTILRNLVSNAIKFSYPYSTVTIRLDQDGSNYSISVIDHGIGMSKSVLDNMFIIDRTNSRKGTDNETGTGLGLILSKELAMANKGDLKIESEEGKGSTFMLLIPLEQPKSRPCIDID